MTMTPLHISVEGSFSAQQGSHFKEELRGQMSPSPIRAPAWRCQITDTGWGLWLLYQPGWMPLLDISQVPAMHQVWEYLAASHLESLFLLHS